MRNLKVESAVESLVRYLERAGIPCTRTATAIEVVTSRGTWLATFGTRSDGQFDVTRDGIRCGTSNGWGVLAAVRGT
jgi:hypothetical protein